MLERKLIIGLAVLALVVSGAIFSVLAFADTTGSHDVTVTITDMSGLQLNSGNITLTINSVPMEATDSTSSLSYNTNSDTAKKITAVLSSSYPTGITLSVSVASASGNSQGEVILTDSPVDVIKNLTQCIDTNQTISYKATATVEAGVTSKTGTVTYTIADQ